MGPVPLTRPGVDLKSAGGARACRGLPGGGGVRGVTASLVVGEGRPTTGLVGSSTTSAGPPIVLVFVIVRVTVFV